MCISYVYLYVPASRSRPAATSVARQGGGTRLAGNSSPMGFSGCGASEAPLITKIITLITLIVIIIAIIIIMNMTIIMILMNMISTKQ